jgi:mannose-1-phosphate guanylyltransferase/mannose-6-phosphate isomerase
VGVYAVIMCGGSGTRLWPVSRPDLPKQFIPLVGDRSSFQETVLRVMGVRGASELLVVAGVGHEALIKAQLDELGVGATLLLEPEPRDSGPAIAAAAAWIAERDPQGLAVIVSSDHHIPDAKAFQSVAARALAVAEEGWIVTLGLRPTEPSVAFGYIKPSGLALSGAIAHPVEAFVEKPDQATAADYIAKGYLWNSGNFIAAAATLLSELDQHSPQISAAARAAVAGGKPDGDVLKLGPAFADAPKRSIDYALMEKTDRAAVAPASFAWSDLGAWDAVKAASASDPAGNVLTGAVTVAGATNCLVRATAGVRVGLVGVSDLAVVVEPGAVLVTGLGASQAVKRVAEQAGWPTPPADPIEATGLAQWAERYDRWFETSALPLWCALGTDHSRGGFEEALDQSGRATGAARRSRVQARQIFVCASAGAAGWAGPWRAPLEAGLDRYLTLYLRQDGLFRALVDADGQVLDEGVNLYDQAFALLALASVFRIDPGRRDLEAVAETALDQLQAVFGCDGGGYREAGEPAFQSNPIMHLFESALAWIEAGGGPIWTTLAGEIGRFALGRLIDPATGAIDEYYSAAWTPIAFGGQRQVWPGHQFEWAWLLDRWLRLGGEPAARAAVGPLYEAGARGVDPSGSVAVDMMDDHLEITDARARLWPQTERLKAALIFAGEATGAERARFEADARDAALGLWRYLETPVPGLWRDRRFPDGRFDDQPAPASSFYHIAGAVLALGRWKAAADDTRASCIASVTARP